MHALRSVLDSIGQKPDSVKALLACLPKEEFALDVHICSYGGVGSTELSNFLTRHGITTNLLKDEDNMRHLNRPPDYGDTGPKVVVYLYGDPLASIASHYRRGHAFHQALKTSGSHKLREAEFPPTLDAYVRGAKDVFGYEEHFSQWLKAPTKYNIVMVRYERMWEPDVCQQLLRLLCGHCKSEAELEVMTEVFCRGRRQRRSEVSPEYRQLMYQELVAAMDDLPPLLVRGPDGQILQRFGTPGEGYEPY